MNKKNISSKDMLEKLIQKSFLQKKQEKNIFRKQKYLKTKNQKERKNSKVLVKQHPFYNQNQSSNRNLQRNNIKKRALFSKVVSLMLWVLNMNEIESKLFFLF